MFEKRSNQIHDFHPHYYVMPITTIHHIGNEDLLKYIVVNKLWLQIVHQ